MDEIKGMFYHGKTHPGNEDKVKGLCNGSVVFSDVEKTEDNPQGRQAQILTRYGTKVANPGDLVLVINGKIKFIPRELVYEQSASEIDKVTEFRNKTTGEVVKALQYLPDRGVKYHKELNTFLDSMALSFNTQGDMFLYQSILVGSHSMIIRDSKGFVFPIYVLEEFISIYEPINQ